MTRVVHGRVCAGLEPLLEPFVDGELVEVLAVCVEAHIRECDACAQAVAQIGSVGTLLDRWPELTQGDSLAAASGQESLAARFREMYLPVTEPGVRAVAHKRRTSVTSVILAAGRRTTRVGAAVATRGGGIAWRLAASSYRRARALAVRRERDQRPGMFGPRRARRPWGLLAVTGLLRRLAGRSVLAMG